MNLKEAISIRQRRFIATFVMLLPLLSVPGAQAAPKATAVDTIVVVVSASSRVTEISHLHLADLYLGRTTRFGDGSPAVPINQRSRTTARDAFFETYLGRSEAQMKAHWSKVIFTGRGRPPAEVANGEAMRTLVAANPRAIGYLDSRLVTSRLRVVRVQ